MIRSHLIIFMLVISLNLSAVAVFLTNSLRYEALIRRQSEEYNNLNTKLDLVIKWLVIDENRYQSYPDSSVTIINHSSRVNLNYDDELILSLPSASMKIKNYNDVFAKRKLGLVLNFNTWVNEEFRDFFSAYTHANPFTTTRNQLRMLYTLKTKENQLPVHLEELINKEELITPAIYIQSIYHNTRLLPIIHPMGRFDIHSIDSNLLKDILEVSSFRIHDPQSKHQILMARRNSSQLITQEDLKILFDDSENLNEIIFYYLGVDSFYYEINITTDRYILQSLVIFWPKEYVDKTKISIAWRKYHAIR